MREFIHSYCSERILASFPHHETFALALHEDPGHHSFLPNSKRPHLSPGELSEGREDLVCSTPFLLTRCPVLSHLMQDQSQTEPQGENET